MASQANSIIVGNAQCNKAGTVNGPYHSISEMVINYSITGLKPYCKYIITLYKIDPLNDIQVQLHISK